MWIGEARTRINPSHPDSLSLSTLLAAATATSAATGETRALQPNKSDLCHPFTPFHPHQSALRRSYVIILRLISTYTGLIELACDPVEEISETNRVIRFSRLAGCCGFIDKNIQRVDSLNLRLIRWKRRCYNWIGRENLSEIFPPRTVYSIFHNSEDTFFSSLSFERCSRRHPFFFFLFQMSPR